MNVTYREKNNGIQAIISYKSEGKWKQKSKQGFIKVSEAKKWAKEKMFELMEMEDKNIIEKDSTLGEVFNQYIELLLLRNSSPNTISLYKAVLSFIEPIQNKKIKTLNSFDLEIFFQKKANETGNSYSNYLALLKIVLNFAKDDLKIISENPARKLKLEKATDNRVKFITEKTYKNILKSTDGKLKLLIQVAYNTGMRLGEIYGLTLKDIYKDHISVNKQWYNKDFRSLKTKNSYREIPISFPLFKQLKSETTDVKGRIFYNVYSSQIRKILVQYNTSIHCFRHTYATRLLNQGISPKYVSIVTGDEIEIIYKRYLELNQDTIDKEKDEIRKMIL